MDRISQAVVFAHDLKKPRTHVFPKQRIKQPQSEPSVIMARTGANAERKLHLRGFFGA